MPRDVATTCTACGRSLPVGASQCPQCQDEVVAPVTGEVKRAGPTPDKPMRFGPWLLVRKLGSGSMGRVYEGRGERGTFAIKVLSNTAAQDAELKARFEREARLGMACRHPHLVAVHERERHADHEALVMDLVEGPTLDAVVERRGRLPWRKAVAYLMQVGEAVAYLHGRGIIHRDLKPENVQLARDDQVVLIDLGFAKELEQVEDAAPPLPALTVTGTSLGSPAYMAPEQVSDASRVGTACDVYGLGATLFHLVTGKLPFDGVSAVAVMEDVIQDAPPRVRDLVADLPEGLEELIDWALAKDPAERPESAAEFCRLLSRLDDGPAGIAALRRQRTRRPLPRWLPVVVGLAVAGALAAGWWFLR